MTGNNEIRLNHGELIRAVQDHFGKTIFRDGNSPKVMSVTETKADGWFLVKTEEKAQPPKGPIA